MKSFPSPLIFAQDFSSYMRIRAWRKPIIVDGFDPASVNPPPHTPSWVDLLGAPAPRPSFDLLPDPDDVLSGAAAPRFDLLRLRDSDNFRCGNLHHFAGAWDSLMTGVPGYDVVRPWIHGGVHVPSFFQHYSGEFNGRKFDSDVPPPMYFQNDRERCLEFEGFVTKTILQRLKEGSMKWLGRVGIDPPPRVVNALSVEPTKPRLILSMRAVNLFCKDTGFALTPLSEIVQHVPQNSFFTGLDDTQGYKHLSLTPESYPFCGFEWSGHWFCDTTLPFGWKNSAYVYYTTGEVFSEWLRSRGIYTALWIDDRFLGMAPHFV